MSVKKGRKHMTIKKRLFYSNMLMVLVPLLAIVVIVGVMGNSINRADYFKNVPSQKLSASLTRLHRLVVGLDGSRLLADPQYRTDLRQSAQELGFRVRIVHANGILLSNFSDDDLHLVKNYGIALDRQFSDLPTVTHYFGASTFSCAIPSPSGPLQVIALHVAENHNSLGVFGKYLKVKALQPITAVFILSGLIIIVVDAILSSSMVDHIMVPINKLLAGAERIKQGDLNEDVDYTGVDELREVCDSFNDMQERLRENINKNIAHERRRQEMIAGISHDLRTPLTSIKSYVKGLKDGIARTPEKQSSYLDIIYLKSCEMETLIESLFRFSKLESGNEAFKLVHLCLNDYIQNYLEVHRADYALRGASIQFYDSPEKLYLQGDATQLNKVFENIIENSIKYAPRGQVAITISLKKTEAIVLRIGDDGNGVPAEALPKLFESFYRVDDARSNVANGSGLGLSIAAYVVEQHGGRIYAENEGGLVICMEFPPDEESK